MEDLSLPWSSGSRALAQCQELARDARAQIYDSRLARMLTHVVVYVCELDKRSVW